MKAFLLLALATGVMSAGCFLSVTHYTARDGSTVYVGNFYNDQPGPGYDLSSQVQGKFYDAAGNLITTQTGSLCQGVNPKGIVPFFVALPPGTAQPARADWSIIGTPIDPHLATGLDATVDQVFKDANGSSWLSGELHNRSTNDYVNGYVCISWTNANGDVVRVSSGRAQGLRFSAGTTLPFLVIADVPPDITTLHFYLDAGVAVPGHPLSPISDVPISAFQHVFTVTKVSGAGTLRAGLGEIANTGTSGIEPFLGAWIRDASGNLLASSGDAACEVAAPPGGVTYGNYALLTPPGTTTMPTVQIQSAPSRSTLLNVNGVQFSQKSVGVYTVTGTVQNASAQGMTDVRVCAAIYDTSGNVVGVEQVRPTLPSSGLASGATVPFTVDVFAFSTASSAKAIADGLAQ